MKRTTITLGIIALMTVMLLPLTGVAQEEEMSERQAARMMQMENRLLIAINSSGLSLEQLQTLQAAIPPVQAARTEAQAAQQVVHDFLVGYTGTAEEFEAAFEAVRTEAQTAFENVRTQMQAYEQTFGDTLTANQAQAFREALAPQRGDRAGQGRFGNRDGGPQQQQQGERGPRFGGPANDSEQGQRPDFQQRGRGGFGQRGGPGGRGPQGMFGNLDVLESVLNAKIEALQS